VAATGAFARGAPPAARVFLKPRLGDKAGGHEDEQVRFCELSPLDRRRARAAEVAEDRHFVSTFSPPRRVRPPIQSCAVQMVTRVPPRARRDRLEETRRHLTVRPPEMAMLGPPVFHEAFELLTWIELQADAVIHLPHRGITRNSIPTLRVVNSFGVPAVIATPAEPLLPHRRWRPSPPGSGSPERLRKRTPADGISASLPDSTVTRRGRSGDRSRSSEPSARTMALTSNPDRSGDCGKVSPAACPSCCAGSGGGARVPTSCVDVNRDGVLAGSKGVGPGSGSPPCRHEIGSAILFAILHLRRTSALDQRQTGLRINRRNRTAGSAPLDTQSFERPPERP